MAADGDRAVPQLMLVSVCCRNACWLDYIRASSAAAVATRRLFAAALAPTSNDIKQRLLRGPL